MDELFKPFPSSPTPSPPKFNVNVNWGALAPMDEIIKPPKSLLLTLALKHWDLGVGASTQSQLQGLNILSIYSTMWGPRSIAKLVNITPITMVYGTQITIVTGANLNQLSYPTGASHCREFKDSPSSLSRPLRSPDTWRIIPSKWLEPARIRQITMNP